MTRRTRPWARTAYKPLLAALCSISLLTSGRTFAYLSASYPVTSTIEIQQLSGLSIAILENGTAVAIQNDGGEDCFIRAAMDYADSDAEAAAVPEGMHSKWTDTYLTGEDALAGYYYYTEPVAQNTATELLYTSAGEVADIYAECIPVPAAGDYESAWRCYLE